MKDIEKSKLNIAMKLILGLGSLISISVVVGVLAILGMLSVQGNSAELADQFLPEISVTNEVERQTLKLMYDIRGFSLSLDDSYYQNGQKDLVNLEKALNEAQVLVDKSPKLNDLKESLPKAKDLHKKYSDLIALTKQLTDKINQARADMDKNAAEFVSSCSIYMGNQYESLNREVGAVSRSALLDRAKKVREGNDILDLGNNIRIGNFKTQALKDASYLDKVMGSFEQIDSKANEILKTTNQDSNQKLLNQIKESATNYKTAALLYLTTTKTLDELAKQRAETGNLLSGLAEEISLKGVKVGQGSATMNQIIVVGSQWTIIIGLLVAMALGVIIALALIRAITKPLSLVTALSRKIALGNFEIQKEEVKSHDELGQLIVAFYDMVDGLKYKAKIIESIAGGNLTNDIQLASEEDALGRSLRQMQDSLNEILTQVNIAVEQMASGADQVSTAAQSLSQGATEQASSLEEISASANEIHSQSKRNADTALSANQLAKQASVNAQKGNVQMTELMTLLERMTKSSEETKKIVKTIDDIAFQVNLLALNANVEAARAGKYGKGFAVVAEEVRNLAVRSGSAVRETTQMVEENLKSIREVNVTAQDTGTQLTGILEIANKVADFLEEIAAASQEQARAMGQINGGLDQIDQVTQSNTASAEESASASEELSGQAQQLKAMVSRFQLNDQFLRDARAKAQRELEHHEHKTLISTSSASSSKPVRAPDKKTAAPVKKPQAPQDDIILNDDFDSF